MSKFKVGDVVRVLNTGSTHGLKVGDIRTIDIIEGRCHRLGALITWVNPEDIELAKAEPVKQPVKPVVKPKAREASAENNHMRKSGHSEGVRFPLTVMLSAVALRKAGLTIGDIARQCNTSSQSIFRWLKQHKLGQFNEPIAFQRTCVMIRT